MPNLWLIFTTGLLTGGITCMAVQGGLLATAVAQRRKTGEEKSTDIPAIGLFLAAKLAAYLLLGLGLGWLGSLFQLSPQTQAGVMVALSLYMMGVGLAMLDVYPFFRRFIIQTPRFLTRYIRRTAKSGDIFTPIFLGLMTVFIPCGTTQAMMALAVATRSPVYGAAVMGAFVLGTSPLFFGLGIAVAKLGEVFKEKFLKVAAGVVVLMALGNLNAGLVLAGSPLSAQRIVQRIECAISFCPVDVVTAQAANEVTINFTSRGYRLDNKTVKAGSKVTLNLVNKSGAGCVQAFVMPALGVQELVEIGQSKTLELEIPDKPGTLSFSCSMGMFSGSLKVI